MGRRHRRLFEEVGVEFVGVADTSSEAGILLEKVSAGELLPDFVVVASPAVSHGRYVRAAVELDLPVLVEKPVVVTVEDALECQNLVHGRNAVVFVGHSERYNPAVADFFESDFFLKMRRLLECSFAHEKEMPLEFRFTRTHGYSERNRDVPVELDLMIHDMDLLCHFVGRDRLRFKSFTCAEYTGDRAVARFDFGRVLSTFVADRSCAMDCRTVEVSMGGRRVTLDLGAYRNVSPAHALQEEHRAFLNCLRRSRELAQFENPDDAWYGKFCDACFAAEMVSLITERMRKGAKSEIETMQDG